MAHARISTYLPPDIDPTQAAIAYGCRALPKLNEELQSEDLLTRQKALMALCDLMHDPEHVYVAINIGCLESLKALLKDTNSMVRIKTTEVLHIMATHNVGREGFLEHDIIFSLSFLLDDPEKACRKNLHVVFKHLAQVPSVLGCDSAHRSWTHGYRTKAEREGDLARAPTVPSLSAAAAIYTRSSAKVLSQWQVPQALEQEGPELGVPAGPPSGYNTG